MGDDRLAVLEARPWALPNGELVSLVDDLWSLIVDAEAAFLAAVREVGVRGVSRDDGATSTQVWLRNRHRMAIATANRYVRLATAVDAAPAAVGEAVAAGKVNLDQAQAIIRAVDRLPHDVGVQVRDDAAAALVGYSSGLDPDQLKVVGERILHLVAPRKPIGRRSNARRPGRRSAGRSRWPRIRVVVGCGCPAG